MTVMALQCFVISVKRCCTSITTSRLTPLQCSRAFASASTQFIKVNAIKSIFRPFVSPVRVDSTRKANHFTSAAVAKDVLLFEHDRTGLFRVLAIFCGGQFMFWAYLGHFAFTSLRDTRKKDEHQNVPTNLGVFNFNMNLGSNAWRYGFTFGCLAIGGGILGLALLFARRSVSRVILHKGGGKVTFYTQSPLGPQRSHHVTVPLSQVASYAHRQESHSFIPLKIKGYKLFFLLDKEGKLNNPRLFDVTVGAYRHF